MGSARRHECFAVEPSERWLFAGNLSGQLSIIDIDTFTVAKEVQAHAGTVRAIAIHHTLPYLATLAADQCVSIWKRFDDGSLHPLSTLSIREICCSNDDRFVPFVASASVALHFHDTEPRLVTRSGNGGVLELVIDEDGTLKVEWCTRLHGEWDLQMTRFAVGTRLVLSAGRDGNLILSDKGNVIRRWRFWDTVAHWAEPIDASTYLIASDAGRVGRVNIYSDAEPILGEKFARDDMEQITYNANSKRAFTSSFDRNVYEVDPATCQVKGVVYSPGYKCVWVKTLERSPSTLIVHSRNGGIYKADLSTGQTLGVIKETPPAIWTGVNLPNGDLVFAGEGSQLVKASCKGIEAGLRTPFFEIQLIDTQLPSNSYSKRMVRIPHNNYLVLGRTDGDIWIGPETSLSKLTNVGSAVRDIALDASGRDLFVATEDGKGLRICLSSGRVNMCYRTKGDRFTRPLWALAYNPHTELVAFAEFGGDIHLLSAKDFSPIADIPSERVKRMRWLSADSLLFGNTDEIFRYSVTRNESEQLVSSACNTVEDFIWDFRGQYLLSVSYQNTITLSDLSSGAIHDVVKDQMDHQKGIGWLGASAIHDLYPWDFVTWGRSGMIHRYRIHDDKIMALGPVIANRTVRRDISLFE